MSSTTLTLDQDVWKPKYNPWLIAVVVALGAFMEVLDTHHQGYGRPVLLAFILKKNEPGAGGRIAVE